jgi:hypothetical protein
VSVCFSTPHCYHAARHLQNRVSQPHAPCCSQASGVSGNLFETQSSVQTRLRPSDKPHHALPGPQGEPIQLLFQIPGSNKHVAATNVHVVSSLTPRPLFRSTSTTLCPVWAIALQEFYIHPTHRFLSCIHTCFSAGTMLHNKHNTFGCAAPPRLYANVTTPYFVWKGNNKMGQN